MKILDQARSPSSHASERVFATSDNYDDILRPGAVVCLVDERGDLICAKQGARRTWELTSFTHRGRFASIPAEALFLILRRGAHIGFQCLGAEGKMIQACEQTGAPHSLAQGFGSREAWEVGSSDGNVLNAHYRFKELGARVHQVTALRTEDLARWEGEVNLRVSDALAKLESNTSAAAASERRAADLIKAGQRAASDNHRELENLRSRLETASRMALHWQEQAALGAESLKDAEAKLAAAVDESKDLPRRYDSGRSPSSRPCSASNDNETIAELRAQISALQMEHAGQIHELESRHSAMVHQLQTAATNESHTAAAVEAVRAEAAVALEEMELAHAAEIERLLEERARLDSALRYIKDMMNPWGNSNNSINNNNTTGELCNTSGGNTTTAANAVDDGEGVKHVVSFQNEGLEYEGGAASDHETLDGCIADDIYLDAPAVGIPVDPLATPLNGAGGRGAGDPLAASYSNFSTRYIRPASAASSGARSLYHYLQHGNGNGNTASTFYGAAPPATISPAPADFAVFDRAGNRAQINYMYDMVNALRPGSEDSSTIGVAAQEASKHEIYHFTVEQEQRQLDGGNGGASSDNEIFASPRSGNLSGSLPTSPESRNRVLMAGGGCAMVDYKGERPDAVTEASMRRILDAPSNTTAAAGRRSASNGNVLRASSLEQPVSSSAPAAVEEEQQTNNDEVSYLVRRPSETSTTAPPPQVKKEEVQNHHHHSSAAAANLRSTPHHHHGVSTSAPASASKSDAHGNNNNLIIDGASPWAAGSLSLPESTTGTPVQTRPSGGGVNRDNDADTDINGPENENYNRNGVDIPSPHGSLSPEKDHQGQIREDRDRSWAPTADVLALDESSPATANFLAQYMADQVSVRASLPARYPRSGAGASAGGAGAGGSRALLGMQPRPKSGGPQLGATKTAKSGKIPAVRHSAPGVLKRSSFLKRPLVSENDLFGR